MLKSSENKPLARRNTPDRSVKIAIQLDPLEKLNLDSDTSLDLARHACARGWHVDFYSPRTILYDGNGVRARLRRVSLDTQGEILQSEERTADLASYDVLLIRQDPPYDIRYITACLMLERLGDRPLILNNPQGLRACPEKLLILRFPELIAPTLVTEDRDEILAFLRKHGEVILKPLHGNGGEGILFLNREDRNGNVLLDLFQHRYRHPAMVQKYLPEVRQGDRRILLIDGEVVGAFNRLPPADDNRSNLHIGGTARAYTLSEQDLRICARLTPFLKENGLFFAGIDIIGDYLTEVNVTSPTGIATLRDLGGPDLAAVFWDKCLDLLSG